MPTLPTTVKVASDYQKQAATYSKYGFTPLTAIYELVDNSLGKKAKSNNVEIKLYVDNTNKHARYIRKIEIVDDGKGIDWGILPKAMGMAILKGKPGEMHEHGIGMKASIAYFGNHNLKKGLKQIKTYDGTNSYSVYDIKDDILQIKQIPAPPNTGTTIAINVARGLDHSSRLFKSFWAPKIGRRYCKLLQDGKSIKITRYDNKNSKKIDSVIVKARKPPYYNWTDASKTPFFKHTFKTTDFECELIIGKTADDFDGDGAWKGPTTGGGGVDIILGNRVVAEQSQLPLDKCGKMSHPKYNAMIGQLIVKSGLATIPKKTDIEEDTIFKTLQEDIKSEWQKNSWFGYFPDSGGNILDENIVRDNVHEMLAKPPYKWSEVGKEKSTYFGTTMDVIGKQKGHSTKTIIEIKVKEIKTNDVNQLVGYMIAEDVKKGVLIGPSMSSNADEYREIVRKKMKWKIDFWNYNEGAYKAFTDGAEKA